MARRAAARASIRPRCSSTCCRRTTAGLPLHPVLELRRRQPRCVWRDARPPRHDLRPRRRWSPCGPDLRRQLPDLRALPLGPRPLARPYGGRPRGGAAHERDGGSRRSRRPWRPSPGQAGRHQRHRLRSPPLRDARHGLRPPRRWQTAPAGRPGLPRHDRRRRDHLPRMASPPARCPGGSSGEVVPTTASTDEPTLAFTHAAASPRKESA